MKLYLFGGAEAEPNQIQPLKNLIKQTITQLNPKSILHIPYARPYLIEEEWADGWFKDLMKNKDIKILDARNQTDVEKATSPLIFINGGPKRPELINGIKNNKKVLKLVLNAEYVVGESSGSMVVAEYMREGKEGGGIIHGLGLLKDTIIEPHYSQRNYQQLLKDEMRLTNARFGIGIDCLTAIVVDPLVFPAKWDKIGNGVVDVQISNNIAI